MHRMGAGKTGETRKDMEKLEKGYLRFLCGGGAHPHSRKEGLVFQVLFAATMALVMVLSVNLLLLSHGVMESVSMLVSTPLWFAFAFALRELYANKVSFFVKERLLDGRLRGFALQASFVFVNVCLMAPVMCAAGVESGILLGGLPQGDFPVMYLHMLPRAAALSFVVVLFLVKPFVTALFGHAVTRLECTPK